MPPATLTIYIEPQEIMQAALDVLNYARDVYELIPEWNTLERDGLIERSEALIAACMNQINKKGKR